MVKCLAENVALSWVITWPLYWQVITTHHYSDVIMASMASQITSLTTVYSTVYSGADKKNIKAPRHWPLCGEFTGDRWIPAQKASSAENVSIWWRHHDALGFYEFIQHQEVPGRNLTQNATPPNALIRAFSSDLNPWWHSAFPISFWWLNERLR